MKKTKLTTIAVIIVMMLSFSMVASAVGPFFDNNYDAIGPGREEGDNADGTGLAAAVASTSQELALNREFVDGNESGWSEENENATKLFDGDVRTKYGTHLDLDDYRAEWKYPEAFVAGNLILCTANDSLTNDRRMDDGWTLSGSNDGKDWKVIYTGKGEDYDAENFAWFVIPLTGNTTAYSHYQILAKGIYMDASNGIQIAELELTKVPQAAAEPEAPAAAPEPEAPVAPEAEAPAAEIPAPTTSTPAPQTADPITLIALGSLISAAGVVIAKKRK